MDERRPDRQTTPSGGERRPMSRGARWLGWAAAACAVAGSVSVLVQTWFIKSTPCDLDADGLVSSDEAVRVNDSALRSLAGLTLWMVVLLLPAVPAGVVAAIWGRRWWPAAASALAVLSVGVMLQLTLGDHPRYDYYFCGD